MPTTHRDTHTCPGGCSYQVPRNLLACRSCWYRLPSDLRAAVTVGYRQRASNPSPHRQALRVALDWYRDNPNPTRGAGHG